MSELPERGRVVCHGFIESVTFVPASDVASFTAVVRDRHTVTKSAGLLSTLKKSVDSSGAESKVTGASALPARLRVTWLGRRRVPGIAAGVELQLQGMLTLRDGLPTMFNPRYEILSRQEHE
ncbi:hypothetical protein M1D88_10205 [Arthrobacter sp. R1-13]